MLLKKNNCVNFTVKIYYKIKIQLYKVRQRLRAAPPDPHVLDLQPVETPFKKSWVRPWWCIQTRQNNEIEHLLIKVAHVVLSLVYI